MILKITAAIAAALTLTLGFAHSSESADTVTVGLNYPESGPYSVQGLDQIRAAELAIAEINRAGGVMGHQVKLATRDSESNAGLSTGNVEELIDDEGAKMVFGGSSSAVAIAAGKVCLSKETPFFGTLSYSTATTGKEAMRYTFRECYNAWAGAKVLADYMNANFSDKKYVYITADYTWGHTTESSFRTLTNTTDEAAHKRMLTPFPGATDDDFKRAISFAKLAKPDVLVLVLFGKDMERAVRQATAMGLKNDMQVVVPNLTLGMAEGGGAKVMEGVLGALPWCWNVPAEFGYEGGQKFVDAFADKYDRYPSTSGASAYTIMYQWKDAVERSGSFDGPGVVRALEGTSYSLLKDEQQWRAFDHQSIQSVYAVRCRPEAEVKADKFGLNYFEVISSMSGKEAFRSREQWDKVRKDNGKPTELEALRGE